MGPLLSPLPPWPAVLWGSPCLNIAICVKKGFPCGSAGKEFACNAGDPDLIPGLGRSSGEGIGYPLQYYWAQIVKIVMNPPEIQETQFSS